MTLFGLVRRIIATRKSPAVQLAFVIVGVAAAAAIRWFIDRGAYGVPFVTFVPVVVLAAVFLDWPFAVFAALASLATAGGLFGIVGHVQFARTTAMLLGAFTFIAIFMIILGHILRQTIIELEAQSEKIRAFNAELQHRTKNTLQIVRALASRAARSTDPVEFYRTLGGRLDALAKANELLRYGSLESSDLGALVKVAMQPFPAWSVDASGPVCTIAGDPGMQLMLVLHELGTNAMKYGALSADGGRVTITWATDGDEIVLAWKESGGPPVKPPIKKGLGSRILSPNGALHAVDLDYRPEGLVCRLVIAAGTAG